MLEDIKFDLQTLDFRALGEAEWAELKGRLDRNAKTDRNVAMRAGAGDACAFVLRLMSAAKLLLDIWTDRLASSLKRAYIACATAHRRRATVIHLKGLEDRVLKDIGLRRCDIEPAVYRPDHTRVR
jgi:uncharacterized protein YjiS (DUF1127 family)